MIVERLRSNFGSSEDEFPYSKGIMARSLMSGGASPSRAYERARLIEGELGGPSQRLYGPDTIQEAVKAVLLREGALDTLHNLSLLERFSGLRHPLVVVIGGTAGSGKSTVATEIAHRLGITRIISTDTLREAMRALLPASIMPSIHYSTFEAHKGLLLPDYEPSDAVLLGFLEQSRYVAVAARAVVARAVSEGYSLVIEGAHMTPGSLADFQDRALICQFHLHISDREEHERRFQARDHLSRGNRPLAKYLDDLPEIIRIQEYLRKRADKTGVPVIEASQMETIVQEIMAGVLRQIADLFQRQAPLRSDGKASPRSSGPGWLAWLRRRLQRRTPSPFETL
jgi:2-phosphoglycerate kinase